MNTPSNKVKAQFFALYLRQEIFRYSEFNEYIYELVGGCLHDDYLSDPFLLLRTADQLTDEELTEVIKLSKLSVSSYYEPNFNDVAMGKWIVSNNQFIHDSIGQYLRSIGILLPFTYLSEDNKPITLSPSDLIGFGWVKMEKEL